MELSQRIFSLVLFILGRNVQLLDMLNDPIHQISLTLSLSLSWLGVRTIKLLFY